MARKTQFELEGLGGDCSGAIEIVGARPEHKPYVVINLTSNLKNGATILRTAEINRPDLERFAVNILKALNSKKLK